MTQHEQDLVAARVEVDELEAAFLDRNADTTALIKAGASQQRSRIDAAIASAPTTAPSLPRAFQSPGIVVGPEQLVWAKTHPPAATGPGSVTYVPTKYPATIPADPNTTGLLRSLLNDSIAAKWQALRFVATGDERHRTNAVKIFAAIEVITAFTADAKEQRRLVLSWVLDNLTQAMDLVAYRPTTNMRRFMLDVAWRPYDTAPPTQQGGSLLDWQQGENWFATQAAAQTGIATILGDIILLHQAAWFLRDRLAQSIYDDRWDGGNIRPIRQASGSIAPAITLEHWNGQVAGTTVFPATFPSGRNAEAGRDLGHLRMGAAGFCHAALTLKYQGVSLGVDTEERLRAGLEQGAQQVLTYLETGNLGPAKSAGGASLYTGFFHSLVLLGKDSLPATLRVAGRSDVLAEVKKMSANATVLEWNTDGYVLA